MALLNNRNIFAQELMKLGWTPVMAAGFTGRAGAESSWNPRAIRKNDAGPGKHSYGAFQWNRERLAGLQRFAAEHGIKDWRGDIRIQARFVDHELKTTHKRFWGELKNSTNVAQAAKVAVKFAAPQGSYVQKNGKITWTPTKALGWNHTLKNATNVAKAIGADPNTFIGTQFQADAVSDVGGTMYGDFKPNPQAAIDNAPSNEPGYGIPTEGNVPTTTSPAPGATSPGNPAAALVNGLSSIVSGAKPQAPAPMSLGEMAAMFRPKLNFSGLI